MLESYSIQKARNDFPNLTHNNSVRNFPTKTLSLSSITGRSQIHIKAIVQFPSNVSELISSVGQSIMSFEQVNKQRKKSSMSVLDQLKAVTTIVADTGDFEGKSRS